jgi:transcriptional regulator with XRE-family HTH domain
MTGQNNDSPRDGLFATRLREAQKEAGLSNRQVARDADISESLLGKYRRGESVPGLANAAKLAAAVGKPLDYFAPDAEEIAA